MVNHSDYQGRYAFNQQPRIGMWNFIGIGTLVVTAGGKG
ncbi:protein adenylyltransferase SelO family protein [Vibrio chagasii]|nr:protein adenylyltransferase SelO family protein [Vibrio chagasii]